MKTTSARSASVRQYLAAVEREAAVLPADRRHELVSDLAEHIGTALAERPGSDAEILRELGDPRVIVATALQESGAGDFGGATGGTGAGKAARRRSPAWVAAALPAGAFLLGQVVPLLGVVLRVAGVVVLCRSPHWTRDRKWTGVTVTAVVPALLAVVVNFAATPLALSVGARWLLVVSSAVLTLGGSGWLWKVRTDRGPAA